MSLTIVISRSTATVAPSYRRTRTRGFTLIELAIALVVVAAVLGSIIVPLNTQVERRQVSDTQKAIDDVRETLYGYAMANGYLPCPDTDNDGVENVTAGKCTTVSGGIATGNLPWVTLGIANTDVWGNRFRYLVNEQFAWRAPAVPAPFSLTTAGTDLTICDTAACAAATKLSTSAIAVILSYGRNGYGAINSITNAANPAPTSADELENTDNNPNIVSHVQSDRGSAAGEFDDIVSWISRYTVFNRMVTAGKLP